MCAERARWTRVWVRNGRQAILTAVARPRLGAGVRVREEARMEQPVAAARDAAAQAEHEAEDVARVDHLAQLARAVEQRADLVHLRLGRRAPAVVALGGRGRRGARGAVISGLPAVELTRRGVTLRRFAGGICEGGFWCHDDAIPSRLETYTHDSSSVRSSAITTTRFDAIRLV